MHALWAGAFLYAVPFAAWSTYLNTESRIMAALSGACAAVVLYALRRRAIAEQRKRAVRRERLDEDAITYTPRGWQHGRPTYVGPKRGATPPSTSSGGFSSGGFNSGGGSFGGGGASGSW